MVGLRIELIDKLDEAALALRDALAVIAEHYGLDDPLLHKLGEAAFAAETASRRLQERADIYGELTHAGLA